MQMNVLMVIFTNFVQHRSTGARVDSGHDRRRNFSHWDSGGNHIQPTVSNTSHHGPVERHIALAIIRRHALEVLQRRRTIVTVT